MSAPETACLLPEQACDSHIHVIENPVSYPFTPVRSFTPGLAPLDRFLPLAAGHGISRAVVVQPSVYGADNRCLLATLDRRPGQLRGVAVIDAQTSEASLQDMDSRGVRGIRLNLVSSGSLGPEAAVQAIDAAVRLIEPLGWHLQVFVRAALLDHLEPLLRELPVALVLDHMGYIDATQDVRQPGFRALLRLLADGRCWVKLGGAHHISPDELGNPQVDRYARELVAANIERLVWGSDWPHFAKHARKIQATPERVGFRNLNYAALIAMLVRWLDASPAALEQVLVTNPRRLYGFDSDDGIEVDPGAMT